MEIAITIRCHRDCRIFFTGLVGEVRKNVEERKRIVTRGRYNQMVKNTQAIQQRIDTLYIRYDNGDDTHNEILEGLSFVIAKNIK